MKKKGKIEKVLLEMENLVKFLENYIKTINKCWLCGKERELTEHHVVPIKKGGDNMGTIPLCKKCHILIEHFKEITELMENEKSTSVLRFKKALNTIKNY